MKRIIDNIQVEYVLEEVQVEVGIRSHVYHSISAKHNGSGWYECNYCTRMTRGRTSTMEHLTSHCPEATVACHFTNYTNFENTLHEPTDI